MKAKNTEEINGFIKITIVVAIFLVIIYGFTVMFVTDKEVEQIDDEQELVDVEIDYDQTLIGSMFDIQHSDYFVLIYKESSRNASLLKDLMDTYKNKNQATKIFYVNLDDVLNKQYYSETSNKKAKNASEVEVTDYTLIRFKNNKIVEYYDMMADIHNKLK